MQEFVARENIRRYRQQLSKYPDAAKRKVLCQLLAEEEAKLERLQAERRSKSANPQA